MLNWLLSPFSHLCTFFILVKDQAWGWGWGLERVLASPRQSNHSWRVGLQRQIHGCCLKTWVLDVGKTRVNILDELAQLQWATQGSKVPGSLGNTGVSSL